MKNFNSFILEEEKPFYHATVNEDPPISLLDTHLHVRERNNLNNFKNIIPDKELKYYHLKIGNENQQGWGEENPKLKSKEYARDMNEIAFERGHPEFNIVHAHSLYSPERHFLHLYNGETHLCRSYTYQDGFTSKDILSKHGRFDIDEIGSNNLRNVIDNNSLLPPKSAKERNDYYTSVLKNKPTDSQAITIARLGSHQHRSMLVNHPNPNVRSVVADHGTIEHAFKLQHDNHDKVRYYARQRLSSTFKSK